MGAGVAAGHMAATRTAHCLHDVCTGKAESTQVGMYMLLTGKTQWVRRVAEHAVVLCCGL